MHPANGSSRMKASRACPWGSTNPISFLRPLLPIKSPNKAGLLKLFEKTVVDDFFRRDVFQRLFGKYIQNGLHRLFPHIGNILPDVGVRRIRTARRLRSYLQALYDGGDGKLRSLFSYLDPRYITL